MEDVIEKLIEFGEKVPSPLTLPNEDELVEIEEAILIPLPFEYKEFLLNASHFIYGSIEPATATDPQSHTYLPELAAEAWNIGVSRELIPICQQANDYYCIEQDGTVVHWSEHVISEESWDSIWQWAKEVWLTS